MDLLSKELRFEYTSRIYPLPLFLPNQRNFLERLRCAPPCGALRCPPRPSASSRALTSITMDKRPLEYWVGGGEYLGRVVGGRMSLGGGWIESLGVWIKSQCGWIMSLGGWIKPLVGWIKSLGGGIKSLGGGIESQGGWIKSLGGKIKSLGGGIKSLGG